MAVCGDRHLGVVRVLDGWVREPIAHAGADQVDVQRVRGRREVVLPDGVGDCGDVVARVRLAECEEGELGVLRVRLEEVLEEVVLTLTLTLTLTL